MISLHRGSALAVGTAATALPMRDLPPVNATPREPRITRNGQSKESIKSLNPPKNGGFVST